MRFNINKTRLQNEGFFKSIKTYAKFRLEVSCFLCLNVRTKENFENFRKYVGTII